ncbi:MAG: GNAT family N-acetyltransferase [Bdellovibrionales bacterium]|jgi:GNAT superfamily N-acetyltransferase
MPDPNISDLRQKPEFFDVVADRVWQEWWKNKGYPIEKIADRLREHLGSKPIPFALVAHDKTEYMGSALVIFSDLEERPQYSPWVAAVWVDPEYRKLGIGAALVDNAVNSAFAFGCNRLYLCASRERRNFYLDRGWLQIEEDVGESLLTVMKKEPRQ